MIEPGAAGGMPFVKAHGTGNDFVLVPDLEARIDLDQDAVRRICDRRFGIGANGILRVVPTALVPEFVHLGAAAEYFMDYRNADGSLAEMCGNGARVFARYLSDTGLQAHDHFAIATRGGVFEVVVEPGGSVTIDMGTASTPRARAMPIVEANGRSWPAVGVLVPNPHAVVFVDDLDEAGDLDLPPTVVPDAVFPEGVNVEFVRILATDRTSLHASTQASIQVAMRVHERGVGETLACGTGACAVAWATLRSESAGGDVQDATASTRTVSVTMPGGTVEVTEADSRLLLNGPVAFVADGTIRAELLSGPMA